MIAMALLTQPQLLIADEPTTALDVTVQQQILQLLRELQRELNMGMLFITHNLAIVRQLAHSVTVMRAGRVMEQNRCAALFRQPRHPYTRELLAAEPTGEPVPLKATPLLLQVRNLQVSFPLRRGWFRRKTEEKQILKQLSFSLHQGESLGLVGESGSGKSSTGLALLRLIAARGEIWFAGQPLHQLTARELLPLRQRIQVVFQDPHSSLNPRMTVQQIIAEGLAVHRPELSAAQQDARVIAVMQETGLDPDSRSRYPAAFSGGQRQRIAIARALILEPQLLILDEPTSSLDRPVQQQILTLLRRLQADRQLTYIFISHDMQVVRALCHQLVVLRQGEVVEQGESAVLFTAPAAAYTRQLLASAQMSK